MSDSHSHKKVANSLVALSSAAVLAVYTAGYLRTKSAADRFAVQAAVRRPAVPTPPAAAPPTLAVQPAATEPAPLSDPAARPPKIRARATRRQPDQGRADQGRAAAEAETRQERHEPAPPALPPAAQAIPVASPAPVAEIPAAVVDPPQAAPALVPGATAKPQYKDGTYYGWGTSRHGDIQAAVVIQDGRIASATIAQCLTRYSCSVIARLPPQVGQRQSPETDYVSGATQSTNAFYYAVVEALSKAK